MRLFVAINFDDKIKDSLMSNIEKLQEESLQGNFTRRENLHLTVVFIGETINISAVKSAIDEIDSESFKLQVKGFGSFKRNGGDIYWRGIQADENLYEIYRQLKNALEKRGFILEDRPFKPHLTLGRRILVNPEFNILDFKKQLPVLKIQVNRISLMKSSRIDGKLTYTEIYAKRLK